ncbi:beta-lactamase family protein [Clostridium estertheticum]|uniref:serine hydrolase domain-containing protein n=1 Tax=Clostridium estertheticum TaxID=238834 RepID=UPI001CF4A3EF|nr:serine hydrolase domain-containing protein [Clostridium estertheticum]MCB2306430.1 beta-lactamase family protein [Clostridium estertheticum]MCB2344806.1 beta-lactamase family protein [Clostridium estertheticum]MCB2349729.1 beta-lactamase family protein [Clostridium estertheticum]WAG46886.1 beta-lactamase family protein [Clostridium estertheticum]
MKKKAERFMAILLSTILISSGLHSNSFGKEIGKRQEANKKHIEVNNSQDLQRFTDGFFKKNMKKYSIPGAAISIVKDGKEVLKKGYGYSNIEGRISVDPDKTVFPAASVSKTFTATAIMQLYEEGKIDLNKNIDNYIKPYKVINPYKEPVTCGNLLTHSSGVDEASELNGTTIDEKSIQSQEYYMDTHIPKVVREPNTVSRYSSEGYNILGYIVEKVSGITYEEYVKKNILEPLKMDNSLVRLKNNNTAKGYGYGGIGGDYNESPLAYQYTSGSSGINATVKDMENFMIAHLNNGEFQGKKILNEKTSTIMKDKQFSNDGILPGIGYGFIRSNRNGQEILKHEGALPSGSTTTLFLMPKEGLGIYIATNSANPLPFNFEEEFLNKFYPTTNNKSNEIKKNPSKDFSKYEGTYRSYDGIAKSNIMKIGFLFDPSMDMRIIDNKDGTLTLNEYTSAKEEINTTLVEKEDGEFVRADGRGDFAFKINDNGKVIYAFNDVSELSFEKISFFDEVNFNIAIFVIAMVIFIINIIGIIVLFIKRKVKRTGDKSCRSIKLIRGVNLVVGLIDIVGIVGAIIIEMVMISNNNFTFAWLLYTFLGFLIVGAVLSICGLIILIYNWVKKIGGKSEKRYFTFLTIVNFIFIWFIYYFNFLGFKI